MRSRVQHRTMRFHVFVFQSILSLDRLDTKEGSPSNSIFFFKYMNSRIKPKIICLRNLGPFHLHRHLVDETEIPKGGTLGSIGSSYLLQSNYFQIRHLVKLGQPSLADLYTRWYTGYFSLIRIFKIHLNKRQKNPILVLDETCKR